MNSRQWNLIRRIPLTLAILVSSLPQKEWDNPATHRIVTQKKSTVVQKLLMVWASATQVCSTCCCCLFIIAILMTCETCTASHLFFLRWWVLLALLAPHFLKKQSVWFLGCPNRIYEVSLEDSNCYSWKFLSKTEIIYSVYCKQEMISSFSHLFATASRVKGSILEEWPQEHTWGGPFPERVSRFSLYLESTADVLS